MCSCSWVVAVAITSPNGGNVSLTVPPSAVTFVSNDAGPPVRAAVSASVTYVSPLSWQHAVPPFVDGFGDYFSVTVGPSLPPPSSASGIPGGYVIAAIAIPLGAEAGILVSGGVGVAGVRATGSSGGAALLSSLTRPLSTMGYAFDILFPRPPADGAGVVVRIPAGTLVAGAPGAASAGAASSPLNEADLWIAVPFVSPPTPLSAGVGLGATWFEANMSLPTLDLSLVSVDKLALLRQSAASAMGFVSSARVLVTGLRQSTSAGNLRRLGSLAAPSSVVTLPRRRAAVSGSSLVATVLVLTGGVNSSNCELLSPACGGTEPCVSEAAGNVTVGLAGAFVQLSRNGRLLALWAQQVRRRCSGSSGRQARDSLARCLLLAVRVRDKWVRVSEQLVRRGRRLCPCRRRPRTGALRLLLQRSRYQWRGGEQCSDRLTSTSHRSCVVPALPDVAHLARPLLFLLLVATCLLLLRILLLS